MLAAFTLLSLMVSINEFQVIYYNLGLEIIPVNLGTQDIISVSPYFDLFDLITVPLMLLIIIIVGFLYDHLGFWRLFLPIVIMLMITIYFTESIAFMILLTPLNRPLFILTLAQIIRFNKAVKPRIFFMTLTIACYVFIYPKTWEFFLSKELIDVLSSHTFELYFDLVTLFILTLSSIAVIYFIMFSRKQFKIKNLPVKFFIACLRIRQLTFSKQEMLFILLLSIIVYLSRYAITHIMLKNTTNFDVNLSLVEGLEITYMLIFCFWLRKSYSHKLRRKLRRLYVGIFCAILLLLLLSAFPLSVSLAEATYYLFYPLIVAVFLPILFYIFLNIIKLEQCKLLGFQLALSFILISIIWRLSFFIAHYLIQITLLLI